MKLIDEPSSGIGIGIGIGIHFRSSDVPGDKFTRDDTKPTIKITTATIGGTTTSR